MVCMIERTEQRLGNYRLLRLLGRGAFSDVYFGEHIYLSTPVAIKVLRVQVDSPTLNEFLTEARHISHLIHPHIIRVFDFDMEGEVPFLVMDYAPYGNLGDLYPSGSVVPLSTIVSYVQALASALQHAHDQHIIHRDLKPENVLLGPKHEVLLSDFGLALLTSGNEILQVKEHVGTLAYMAPEQLGGRPGPASDQYSLAVMVYKWLTGRLPFQGSHAYLSIQHLDSIPPLRERSPEIPLAVEWVLSKALSKEPSQRYIDVLSFAGAFEEACQTDSSLSQFLSSRVVLTEASEVGVGLHGFYESMQNVPASLTPMIGREQELKEARAWLLRPEVRLLTLTGPGGIGKTRFATALSIEMLPDFAQNACAVWLAPLNDPDLVIPSILQALGLSESKKSSPFEQLTSVLGEKPFLLLLDNFEHLLPAAPQLLALLAACPHLKIIVTSRATLHLQGEFEFAVPPLALPDLHQLSDVEELAQVEAVALFLRCAEARNHKFKLTQDNAAIIAEICNRLEGLPLAIELAARRSKVLSLPALLARLEYGLEVLTSCQQNVAAHQQNLRSSITWSYDLLSSEEQKFFRRLAVFEGPFSLGAAEAIGLALGGITLPILDVVTSLIDKNVLRQGEQARCDCALSLLGPLRAYGLERLAAAGELEGARDAHAQYYLALAEQAESALSGDEPERWLEQWEWQSGNLRAALRWLLQRGQREEALRLMVALEQFWLRTDQGNEGLRLLVQALETPATGAGPISAPLKARAMRVRERLQDQQHGERPAPGLVEGAAQARTPLRLKSRAQERARGGNLEGQRPICAVPARDGLASRSQDAGAPPCYEMLTAREVEVMHLLALGLRNAEIAERLVVSPHTVNGHVQSIYGKLGVNSRSAVTRYALKYQLV